MILNHGWTYRERVKPTDAGLTILDYYSRYYKHSTTEEWRDRICLGEVVINDCPVTPETILETDQKLSYHRQPWQEPDVPLSFEIIYQDEDLLVVFKPSGLPVLPGGNFLEGTLLHQLRAYFPEETPVPIHRLGRGTSGLMILARSPLARSHLSQQLRDRQMTKIYRALIGAGDFPDQQMITQPIGKIFHPSLGYIYGATAEGMFAQSHVQVLRRDRETTLVDVNILTGRPHQIRIHLAAIGYPLIGDPLYQPGGIPKLPNLSENAVLPGDCGYHLHARYLHFVHPKTLQNVAFHAPPPAILADTNS